MKVVQFQLVTIIARCIPFAMAIVAMEALLQFGDVSIYSKVQQFLPSTDFCIQQGASKKLLSLLFTPNSKFLLHFPSLVLDFSQFYFPSRQLQQQRCSHVITKSWVEYTNLLHIQYVSNLIRGSIHMPCQIRNNLQFKETGH